MMIKTALPPLPHQVAAKAPQLNTALALFDNEQMKVEDESELLGILRGIGAGIKQIRKNCGSLLTGEKKPGEIDAENFMDNYNMASGIFNRNLQEAEALLVKNKHLLHYSPLVKAARAVMDILMSMRNLRDVQYYPLETDTGDDGIVGSIYEGKT